MTGLIASARLVTVADIDEWADIHRPPVLVSMTPAEMREGLHRLSELADLVGYVPAEVMAGLRVTIVRRDAAAMFWLRLLRSIDCEACS